MKSNEELINVTEDAAKQVRVVRASADQGPVLRRWKAKARGRVGRIRRPSSLIIIEVDEEAVRRMGVTRDNAQL